MKERETHRQLLLRALQRFELEPGRAWEIGQEIEAQLLAEKAALEADAERVPPAAEADGSRAFPFAAKAKVSELPPWPKKPRGRGKYVRVFDPAQVDAFAESIPRRHGGKEERERATATVRRIREAGAWRRTLGLSPVWRQHLDELELQLPNFRQPLDYLRAIFALSEKSGRMPECTVIGLDGDPGIGKSFFGQSLASALDAPFHRLEMSTAQSSGQLVGTERFYSDSTTGLLFDALAYGNTAAPVVVLEELCQSQGDDRFMPTNALYGLWEPITASNFHDLSIPEIELDARHVLWIATSNDAAQIPAPIRSRMRLFAIPRQSHQQALETVQRMYRLAGEKYLPGIALPELGDEVVERLVKLAPRAIQIALTEGFGRLAYQERVELRADDFPVASDPQRKVGFV